jgi:hypothetical protein
VDEPQFSGRPQIRSIARKGECWGTGSDCQSLDVLHCERGKIRELSGGPALPGDMCSKVGMELQTKDNDGCLRMYGRQLDFYAHICGTRAACIC